MPEEQIIISEEGSRLLIDLSNRIDELREDIQDPYNKEVLKHRAKERHDRMMINLQTSIEADVRKQIHMDAKDEKRFKDGNIFLFGILVMGGILFKFFGMWKPFAISFGVWTLVIWMNSKSYNPGHLIQMTIDFGLNTIRDIYRSFKYHQ